MGAYMYPIKIKRTPQVVRYNQEFELGDGALTLAILRQYVNEDQVFSIRSTDEGICSKDILSVGGTRLETTDEMNDRIEKQEKYMNEYNKRHSL